MNDRQLWESALVEASEALELLREPAPTDQPARRRQLANIARKLNKAARVCVAFEVEA